MLRAIFVVGTGRSGTHFTVRALNGFENTHDPKGGVEHFPTLYAIARAAIGHRSYPAAGTRYLRKQVAATPPGKVLIDQHHPHLFFTDAVKAVVPEAVFLYPDRPAPQIVASMLRHNGVQSWYTYAKRRDLPFFRLPMPNRFLGLDSYEQLKALPLHQLCAHRIMAHRRQAEALAAREPALRMFSYEDLVRDQEATFTRLFTPAERDALGPFRIAEASRVESLEKYRDVLDNRMIDEIEAIEAAAA